MGECMLCCSLNPCADRLIDGTSLNPMEVIFVKFKQNMQEAGWAIAEMTAAYSALVGRTGTVKRIVSLNHLTHDISDLTSARSSDQGAPSAINRNALTLDKLGPRMGQVLQMMLRGSECFDFDHYKSENWYIPSTRSEGTIWNDFVEQGQFLGGKFR